MTPQISTKTTRRQRKSPNNCFSIHSFIHSLFLFRLRGLSSGRGVSRYCCPNPLLSPPLERLSLALSQKLARPAPINRLCCFAGNFLIPAVFGLYTLFSTHHSLIPTLGFRQLGCQQPAAAVETIRLQHPPLSFLLSPSFPSMPTFSLSLSFLLFSPSASSHHLRYIITTPMLPNRAPVRAYVVGGGGVGVVLLLPFLLLFFPSFPVLPLPSSPPPPLFFTIKYLCRLVALFIIVITVRHSSSPPPPSLPLLLPFILWLSGPHFPLLSSLPSPLSSTTASPPRFG